MVKISMPNKFQFRMMPEIRGFIFPKRGGEIHYIGGAEILPAPFTVEEEEQVMKKLGSDDDKEARSSLIEHNLRLVVYIAKKFDNTGVGVEDLISIGTIGLIKAINTFNPLKNIKLATYASRCIENEILMHLRSAKKINQEVSLNEVIGVDKDGSEVVLEDLIDNKEKPILDQIYDADNLQKLIQCFDVLTSKEKDILIKRYGLNSSKKMTQKEIAKEYHISRSYISRIEKRALIKLLKCYLQEKEG